MDPDQRYVLIGGAVLGIAAVLAVLFPRTVYDQFIWQYLWGPIVADAHNQQTAVHNGITAARGYTAVSIAVYAVALLYAVLLVPRLLDRWNISIDRRMVLSFAPFMVFGGLLRVIEDASLISFPGNTLFISPVIYGTLFVTGLALLGIGAVLTRRGTVPDEHVVVRVLGGAAAAAVFLVLAVHSQGISPAAPLLLTVPAVAILLGLGVQHVLAYFKPGTFLETRLGQAAVAAQVLDGAVTAVVVSVVGASEKLPLSAWIIDTFSPAAFPVVKLGVAVAFLSLIHEDDDDRVTLLLVLVLIAVGLGPGIRNLSRSLFGF